MTFCSKFTLFLFNLVLLFVAPSQMNAQIFSNTLTLAQFGAINNTIPTLQASATYNINPFLDLRTNDFQPLELGFMTYSTNRQMLRMGALLNSQSPLFFGNNPPGPGLTFPDIVAISDPITPLNPNPARNITIDTNRNRLVFSAVEFGTVMTPATVTIDADPISQTAQSLLLTYTANTAPGSIVDYNVIGNPFHDMQYTTFTPLLSCTIDPLFEVTVFSASLPGGQQTFSPWTPPSGPTVTLLLPAGNKLRLKFYVRETGTLQTWLIYFQESDGTDSVTPPAFEAVFGQAPATLTAQSQFTGFIRAAIVQTEPVPFFPPPGPISEVFTWSTAIGIQTIAPAPADLFMLWPIEFVNKATQKIENNFQTQTFVPVCQWLAIFLPVLGRTDIYTATEYFNQLTSSPSNIAANFSAPVTNGTNPFLTYLYMQFANLYTNDIACYQLNQRPFPNYGITATPTSVESVYDNHRDSIPTNAELIVNLNQYLWSYTKIGSPVKNPLILFPGYKTVNSTLNSPIQGFLINDPAKGILYAVDATNNQIVFNESPLPDFLNTQFFPSDFFRRLTTFDVILAKSYMDLYFNDPANLNEINQITNSVVFPNAYDNGKVLYKAASSVRFATALMTYLNIPRSNIISITKPFVDAIKSAFEAWLFRIQATARAQPGFPNANTPNFFCGDSTVGGICFPIQAMIGNQPQDIFFGNAEYNDHHFQYGYWLGAASGVIDWDNEFGTGQPGEPWIAQLFQSGTGQGPFKMKQYIDVLWRDTVNPDTNDSSFPYHRHGNTWEGHSTANGLAPIFFAAGRNQESLAEDFNCWLGALFYAKSVLATNNSFPGALSAADLQGFDQLSNFCSTYLSLTATSGDLYYNTSNWPYANIGFNFNAAVGNQFDGLVDSATFFGPGEPPCEVCN